MILKLAKALSELLLCVVPLLTLLVLVSVFIGDPDTGNITKVVFAEQTSRDSGFSYLTGENDNNVYPDGMYLQWSHIASAVTNRVWFLYRCATR